MRKLNTKNKTYILALSLIVLLVLVVVGIFIYNKIKDMNIRYDITQQSYVYNSKNELEHLTKNVYAKKDLLGTYYIMDDDNKIEIGKNAVILRKNTKEVQLLGNYYEIKDNGEIDKLTGENIVSSVIKPHYYKIGDRKYLIIAPEIKSEDGSLNTNNFLLINIDKKGNAYLYNHEVNIKTFSVLKLVSGEYVFNVNEEKLAKNDQVIDLSKINGSTNEYVASDDANGTGSGGSGTGDGTGNGEGGDGSGTGGGAGGSGGSGETGADGQGGSGSGADDSVPEQETETIYTTKVEIQEIVSESYIYRKTTILGIDTDVAQAKINYVIYDPLDEYASVYAEVYKKGGQLVGKYPLKKDETESIIKDLDVSTEYDFRFHYTYVDTNNVTHDEIFDNVGVTTKSIKGEISLEKVSQKDVTYIVKIDKEFVLDSANVNIYVDDELVGTQSINVNSAAAKNGFKDTFTYDFSGKEFVILKLTDCKYKNSDINIDATYKFKL